MAMARFNKKQLAVDLRFAFLYLILPVILGLLLINTAFQEAIFYIYEKYNYTGSEMLSPLGFLDLAHYRYYAPEEIMGWQWFFGNFQFFIIFALFMAGTFLLLKPRRYNEEGNLMEITPTKKSNRIGFISIIGVGLILVLELFFRFAGDPETGLGSHIYIEDYFRTIPELIADGYYVINNRNSISQTFLSFIPIFCGFGTFYFIHGVKNYRERGLVEKKFRLRKIGLIFFIGAFLYFNSMAIIHPIELQNAVTSYTFYMVVFWLLNAIFCSGVILIVTRIMIPYDSKREGRYKFKLKPIIFFLIIFMGITSTASTFLLPHLGRLGVGENVEFFGVIIMQIFSSIVLVFFISYALSKEKLRGYNLFRAISLMIGFASLIFVAIYWAINPNAGNIEISWMYNSIIPSIFLMFLTVSFYFFGLWIQKSLRSLKSKMINSPTEINAIKKRFVEFARSNRSKTIAYILIFINIAAVPCVIGFKMFGEKPQILVNNLGMLPDQDKTFFLAMRYDHEDDAGSFDVIDDDTDSVVFSGDLEQKGLLWGRYHWLGNFSILNTPGRYHIRTKLGLFHSESYSFEISEDYLDAALHTSLYWFYYMRCGTAVKPLPEHAEKYVGHKLCHEHDAWYLYNDTEAGYVYINSSHTDMGLNLSGEWVKTAATNKGLNLTGGWHDSGDYNVYGTRVGPCSHSLVYAFEQIPEFYNLDPQRVAYPQNDTIPDIIEESWFGLKYWMRRFYEPEQLYFDSNMLGANGSIRWTVFGPPEYDEDFGYGRWVAGDFGRADDAANASELYKSQFLLERTGHLVTASFAAMARLCEEHGYYHANITQMKEWANKSRRAYADFLGYEHNDFRDGDSLYWKGYDYRDLVSESEMYKLTGNTMYLQNAINITNFIIGKTDEIDTLPPFNDVGFALRFAQEFNGSLGWDGLGYIDGNKTIETMWEDIRSRTQDERNYFNFLRESVEGSPIYNNARWLTGIFASSYAWNMTENSTIKAGLYNFMTQHYDWMFGRNMENICQVEGIQGGENPVQWYTTRYRYIPGNLRGANPGYIIDGFDYFPGDYGEKNDPDKYAIPQITNTYREVWSDIAYAFQLANNAFYKQVLNR